MQLRNKKEFMLGTRSTEHWAHGAEKYAGSKDQGVENSEDIDPLKKE
jgi:hypothetical protein